MKNKDDLILVSPLTWAYIGDAVYELYVREYLIKTTNLKPHRLHIETIKFVKASAQAKILYELEKFLTEEEKDIVRRGRNTETHSAPKNADLKDYMYATAFEALIGYLYVSEQKERLDEILKLCIDIKNNINN